MTARTNLVTRAILFAIAGLPAFRTVAAAVQCESRSSTKVEVPVYSVVPQFSTARGWELGAVIATLPPGASVRICETRQVGFPGDKKEWRRIVFDRAGSETEGWIYGVGTLVSARRTGASTLASFFGPSIAYAQGPEKKAVETGLPGERGPWLFYAWAFLAICLGMAAKSTFDWLQQGGELMVGDYLIRTIPALLVSPMVFLSLSQFADVQFDPDGHSFIVALCTAFQSGFFWQTVLVRATAASTQPAQRLVPVAPAA